MRGGRIQRKQQSKQLSGKGFAKEILLLAAQGALIGGVVGLSGGMNAKLIERFGKYAYHRLRSDIARYEKYQLLARTRKGRIEMITITDKGKQRLASLFLRDYT